MTPKDRGKHFPAVAKHAKIAAKSRTSLTVEILPYYYTVHQKITIVVQGSSSSVLSEL